MKILVTAASSQTGSLAVRALVRERHTVRCLLRRDGGRRFLPRSGVELFLGDLEKPQTVSAALEGVDAVVQIAHIRFAPELIAACARAGIRRVIFFSSTRRYTKFDCLTARQVRDGEKAIEASDLDYTILRPSMIYGSARDNNISRLIGYLCCHRVFPLVAGGKSLIQPVFVRDVVGALVEALKRPNAVRSAYTLAGAEAISYRRMIEMIAIALDREARFISIPLGPALFATRVYQSLVPRPRVTTEQIQRFAEDRAFDISDARRDLDFAPVGFEEGVRRQVAGEIDAVWSGDTGGS